MISKSIYVHILMCRFTDVGAGVFHKKLSLIQYCQQAQQEAELLDSTSVDLPSGRCTLETRTRESLATNSHSSASTLPRPKVFDSLSHTTAAQHQRNSV